MIGVANTAIQTLFDVDNLGGILSAAPFIDSAYKHLCMLGLCFYREFVLSCFVAVLRTLPTLQQEAKLVSWCQQLT